MRKLIYVAVMAIAGMVLMTGPLMAAEKTEVRVALMGEPSTLNTLEFRTGYEIPVVLPMHSILMRTDHETGLRTIEGTLSEEMEIMPDNKSIRIKLKKDYVFHTGDPVTAHDVKFTYEQCVNPENANMMAAVLDVIEEIEVIDDHNLVFHLWEPYAGWRHMLWMGIVSKKYYEKVGREKFRKHPVGSGAFKFVKRVPGQYIEMEVFEDHPSRKTKDPKFPPVEYKTLKFMIIPDEVTRLAMLETGEVDIVKGILPHHLKRLEKNKNVVIKREENFPSFYGLGCRVWGFPIFKAVNFGKAILHSINRQEIIDRVFLGDGYPLYHFGTKRELGYRTDNPFPYDPEKAKKFLKASSYKSGDPITLVYTSAVPNGRMIASMIQRYMTQTGINLKLQQLDPGVEATYSRNKDKRGGHIVLYTWAGSRDPDDRWRLAIASDGYYTGYPDRPNQKEIDALIKAQSSEMDRDKREKMMYKLHDLLAVSPGSGMSLLGLNLIYAHSDRIDYTWLPGEEFIFNMERVKILK